MSIFDFTLAGALANSLEIAREKERQNANGAKVLGTDPIATPHISAKTITLRIWLRMLDTARAAQTDRRQDISL